MKTSKRKVTRGEFIVATQTAMDVIKKKHPRTKLAYYCEQFLELNTKISKEHNKLQTKLTRPFSQELKEVRVLNAVEKDGKLWLNEKEAYQYDRKGESVVAKKEAEVTEKITEAIEVLFEEELEVKCICTELEVPKDMDYEIYKCLNGFAFKNKNEFEETIESGGEGSTEEV